MVLAAALLFVAQPPKGLLDQVSAERLMATVQTLAANPTRNTSSPGLTAACEWAASQFKAIPRLQVELMTYHVVKGPRVPEDKDVVEVVAVLPGRTDRRVLVGGHIDTINLREDPMTGRAPGANDDGSGVALTMELARVMAPMEWENTVVFVCFSGEEQGLFGSIALAQRAKTGGWKLEAVLSNDIVGNSANVAKYSDKKHVRVFSDAAPETSSRELARFIEWQVRQEVKGFGIKLVLRNDRFGRGGDHSSFLKQGFTAVRFCEVWEDFTRQHNDQDLPQFVDPAYLRHVAQANLSALAALANAGVAPARVRIDRRQGIDTHVTWTATPGVEYVLYWRDSASPTWQGSKALGAVGEYTMKGTNKDDNVFAVGAKGGIPVEAT